MMRIGTWWNRRGQSTLEYLLIAAAVIAVIAIAAGTVIGPAVKGTLDHSKTAIDHAATQISTKLQ